MSDKGLDCYSKGMLLAERYRAAEDQGRRSIFQEHHQKKQTIGFTRSPSLLK
jgi:hypothetical protein